MKTIKVGVIGAGAISRVHIQSINSHRYGEVIAIADTSEKRARKMAGEFNITRIYSSARELINDKDIDAVTIAVPNKFHASYAIAALNAGKHVCLEKPFAMNAGEARRVIDAVKAKRKIFTLGMNWRFKEDSQIVRKLVKRGDIGQVYHAKSIITSRLGSPKFGTWFCRKDMSGGGAMMDIGVHYLDLCLYLIDNFKPVAVSSATYSKLGPRGIGEGGWGMSDPGKPVFNVDDFGTAMIRMKNDTTITLDAAWILHQEDPGLAIVKLYGTEGGASTSPAKLFRLGRGRGKYKVMEPRGIKIRYPHCDRFHNWLDAIAKEDELEVKLDQALTVQKILDAIYVSSRTKKEVRIK